MSDVEKRPAFQFYPRNWQTDTELRSCSIAARGMWMDMLCIAHWAQPYGHLTLNGKRMTDAQIVNAISGASRKLLSELEAAGVFSRTTDGTIYSRRMTREERVRSARANGGALGAADGAKGGKYGAMGGRPPRTEGGERTPLPGESEPPLKPPPAVAVAVASAVQGQPPGVVTPTVEASAVDKSTPDGDKSPESQRQNGETKLPPKGWHASNDGIEKAATLVGVTAKPGELHGELKRRTFERIAEIERQGMH